MFEEYDENLDPLFEWCTALSGVGSLGLSGICTGFADGAGLLFYTWRAACSPIVMRLLWDW